MAVVILRKKAASVASASVLVGLEAFTFPLGARVSVVSPKASRFKCKVGALGTVEKACLLSGCHDQRPDSDLYFVRLDSGDLVYCNFPDLKLEE